jgi:TonB-linked SusC/RagA family outer membrane protein
MGPQLRQIFVASCVLAFLPAWAAAQGGATVTGRVTSEAGGPLASASVFLEGMGLGTISNESGQYSFVVPAARATGQQATLTARLVGYRPRSAQITLSGERIVQDFVLAANPLQLGEVVVTGAGTTTTAEKLGSVRNVVSSDIIARSNEQNVVQALAAKAPNVEVTQSSGEPGASSYFRIRGQRTISGNSQPLIVVDGLPIDNSSYSTSNFNPTDELGTGEISGTAQMNRAMDINPDDIESVEILKGPAAGAIYGARAGQGVVLITTKKGRAGQTRYSLRTSYSWDDMTREYPLQRRFGQGLNGVSGLPCEDINKAACLRSWGPEVPADQTFDHATEAFDTGHILDQTLSVSGGNDRTTFYFSGSYMKNEGVFKGPNNEWDRATVRLNASHRLIDQLNLAANISYTDTRGDFVQRGNNVNGLQLGLLRTPPDFNNLPYLDPTSGLHRSFRLQNPGPETVAQSRGFDNPFFILNEPVNLSRVGRVFGNAAIDYAPLGWLSMRYTLGADYSNDERLEGAPQESSDVSAGGRVTEGTITTFQLDHNLSATANYTLTPSISGSLTLGQNLSVREVRQISVVGRTLVAPEPFKLSNTVTRDLPIDDETNIRGESYFGQLTVDLYDQLFLTFAARNDGSSTFGSENRRSWFPKASVAWTFTNVIGERPWLTVGKVRAAYGEAGTEPDPYLTLNTFDGATLLSGIAQGTGFTPTQSGFGGLVTNFTKGNNELKPERSKELEAGIDLGLFRDRADLSLTFYNTRSEDVILPVPLPPSTGFSQQFRNAGVVRNRGVELSLNVRPITRENFGWELGFQWATNKSKVLELEGADFVPLDGLNQLTPYAVAKEGEELGVFYDFGWARCGVSPGGMDATVEGFDLDVECAGAPRGALFIGPDGFPVGDDNRRVVGNPNPDWTGSVRTAFRYGKWQVSGLVDIRQGGDIYNGTRSALYSYGTHKDTEIRAVCDGDACTGNEKIFGQGGWFDGPVAGPGAGTAVPIGENWYRTGLGPCAFTDYSESCIEDGGYVKLREISLAYTLDNAWVRNTLGLTSIDLRVAGRNLKTWTDYTGYDPETNLGGAIHNTRGYDYFVMPQTRSFVLSVGLNR